MRRSARTLVLLATLAAALVASAAPCIAQDMRVTSATLVVTPPRHSGACPHVFTFNGSIVASGRGTVEYRFVRSDGALAPVQRLTFWQPGPQPVEMAWSLAAPGPTRRVEGWAAIQVLSPNALESGRASFVLECPAAPADPGMREMVSVKDTSQQPNAPSKEEARPVVVLPPILATIAPDAPRSDRATYRITLEGVRMNHEFRDGLLDAGDTVYVEWLLQRYDRSGLAGSAATGRSSPAGWQGLNRPIVAAGTRTDIGGMRAGDEHPPGFLSRPRQRAPGLDSRFPLVLPDLELVSGRDSVLLVPTLWRADGDEVGNVHMDVMRYVATLPLTAVTDAMRAIGAPAVGSCQWRVPQEYRTTVDHNLFGNVEPRHDNPYGRRMTGPTLQYTPIAILLTREMADSIVDGTHDAFTQQLSLHSPGLLAVTYGDFGDGAHASATLFVRVERF